jgi:hypothetical protein
MFPDAPTTNFPEIEILPFNVPSILTSPLDLISPVIDVPLPIKLIEALSIAGRIIYF